MSEDVTKSGITSTVETQPDKALAADPTLAPQVDAPSDAAPLGWLPDAFVVAWITKNSDDYKVVAEADYNNGRTVVLMLHPKSFANSDPARLEPMMDKFAEKIPGRYWQRIDGMRLHDCPVFTVFMTQKRTAPARIGF